jgi:hypothetical protein
MHWTIEALAQKAELPEGDVRTLLQTNWTVDLLAVASGLHRRYVRSLLGKKISGVKLGRDWTITRANGDAWLASRDITVED